MFGAYRKTEKRNIDSFLFARLNGIIEWSDDTQTKRKSENTKANQKMQIRKHKRKSENANQKTQPQIKKHNRKSENTTTLTKLEEVPSVDRNQPWLDWSVLWTGRTQLTCFRNKSAASDDLCAAIKEYFDAGHGYDVWCFMMFHLFWP